MSRNRIKRHVPLLFVLAGIITILSVIFFFSFYSFQSLNLVDFRIISTRSFVSFVVLLGLGLGSLSIIGTLLDTLRTYLFKDHFRGVTTAVQEIILIWFFWFILIVADQWIEGVELGNVRSGIILAIFVYGLVSLIGKLGDHVKEQDQSAQK